MAIKILHINLVLTFSKQNNNFPHFSTEKKSKIKRLNILQSPFNYTKWNMKVPQGNLHVILYKQNEQSISWAEQQYLKVINLVLKYTFT